MRSVILAVALLFIIGLGGLTLQVLLEHGFDVLVGFSLLVLALFGFGIVGALLHPPEE